MNTTPDNDPSGFDELGIGAQGSTPQGSGPRGGDQRHNPESTDADAGGAVAGPALGHQAGHQPGHQPAAASNSAFLNEQSEQPTTELPGAAFGQQRPAYAPHESHAPSQPQAPQAPQAPQLPDQHGAAGYPHAPTQGQTAHDPHRAHEDGRAQDAASAHPKSRTGALLAGLAIGALVGGVVGGGVAAVVASNAGQHSTASGSGTNSTITLNNAENATAISGVAAVALPSVVTLEVASSNASGSGSGVIYRSDGYIITNAHVVTLDGAATEGQTVRVKLSDGRILDGSVKGIDPYADIAVVKVDATDLPAVKMANSDKVDVGDLTVAIGAPLNLSNTVTSGVVSALNRGISVSSTLIPKEGTQRDGEGDGGSGSSPWDFRFGPPDGSTPQQTQGGGTVTLPVIQTDASINPGNSGGALLNGKGELIGVNVAIASTAGANGTAGSDGLGFAIPANLAARVADAIIAGDQPSHGLLGASVADSSQDTDADANHAGGLLVDVTKGGAGDKAGLRVGDVITAIDGVPAVDGTSVSALIRMHEGGSTVKVEYTRDGKPGETEVTLGQLKW
ncbi:S1C family serine protease [Leucobacter luti]|uniref:S1C family serine protease n=1 Tax=Leucobacter luti TaxID=340320 RepID=UPI003D0615CC